MNRRAFSLLEVILAIALSVVVVYLVAAGIDFHLRQMTIRKTKVEDAQLARAVLRQIADDLRAVVVDRPIDFSGLEEVFGELATVVEGNADEEFEEDSSADEIINATIPMVPGIYGSAFELQIDVGRIPRYEEYVFQRDYGVSDSTSTLSDTRTVSYFVVRQGASTLVSNSTSNLQNLDSLGLAPGQAMRGLGRRVIDHSVGRHAMQNGNFAILDERVEMIAPEVAVIEFRYFDGQQWTMEWDTESRGGIPLAIEILLLLSDADMSVDELDGRLPNAFMQDPDRYFRLVVHLPAGEMIDALTESDLEDQP